MRDIVLFSIFLVHAAVFLRFYLMRGRRTSHLIFVAAFVLLAIFKVASHHYAPATWPSALRYLAWAMLASATVLLLVDRPKDRRSE